MSLDSLITPYLQDDGINDVQPINRMGHLHFKRVMFKMCLTLYILKDLTIKLNLSARVLSFEKNVFVSLFY